jgi:hypothetical protein
MTIEPLFITALSKMARLTQEDPASPVESLADAPASLAPSPYVVFPWLAAQLFSGFVGFKQYDSAVNDYLDFLYEVMSAVYEAFLGTPFPRTLFDLTVASGIKTSSLVKLHKRARLAGYSAAGLGLAGTAAAYKLGAVPVFPVIVAFSLLPSIFVLAQALLTDGEYAEDLDPTNPAEDSIEDLNPGYRGAKNYMLYGSLGAIAVELYAIGASLMAMDVAPAAPESEAVASAEDETTPD